MALIWLSCAWVAGVFTGFNFNLPPLLLACGLLPLPFLFLGKYRKPVILTSLCLFAFFGGAFYSYSTLPVDGEHSIGYYNDSGELNIRGMVADEPDARESSTRLRLSDVEIEIDGNWQEVTGDALLFVPRYPEYSYGDVLLVNGELETPPVFEGFDYADYLSREGIYSTMRYPRIETADNGRGFAPLEWLYGFRGRLSQILAKALPQPQASLAQGMILGIRGNIPEDVQQAFSRTGTSHLLAISGLHLGIIAGLALSLGTFLFGKKHYVYVWLALAVIWLYALLTGMHPPVVRGAIMASVFLAAELLGRQRSALTALAFTAAVMVAVEPQIIFMASFQLSFLAMADITLLFPRLRDGCRSFIERKLGNHQKTVSFAGLVADGLCLTIAATVFVWPIVACNFGIVSLAGPFATLLALPVLPGIIISGALTAGLGLIALPAAYIVGWLAWLFLSYLLLVVNACASLPYSFLEAGFITPAVIWIYYAALAAAIWLSGTGRLERLKTMAVSALKPAGGSSGGFLRRPAVKWLAVFLVIIIVLAGAAIVARPDDRLHVCFLDVGQGDAILISRGSTQVLVDGGPGAQDIMLELGGRMPFWDRTIELVVLTHPHADHLTGLVEVLANYEVRQVLYPEADCDLPLYEEWIRLIDENGIKQTIACAGQKMEFSGVVIEVLNPQSPPLSGTESDTDNNSVVLSVEMGDISFLLTGDIMRQGEAELVNERLVAESTVLKVAHHGSGTSSSAGFLGVVCPQIAVICVGEDNDYGHPDGEVLRRLEAAGVKSIYRTDEDGTIEFITDGGRLWIKN